MHGAFPVMSQAKAEGSLEVRATGSSWPPLSRWMISFAASQLAHLNRRRRLGAS